MRSLSTVFLREIRERRAVFAAALVAGLMAFPLAWAIHRASGFGFQEALAMTAYVLAAFLGAGMAVGLGATAIGRDLGEGRFGFYLSKPIPSLALWAGKLGAAYAVVLGVVALVLLPAALAGSGTLSMEHPSTPWWTMNLGGVGFDATLLALSAALWFLLLILASNAAGVMVRSRSPLILLDAVLAAAVVWSVVSTLQRITAWGVWYACAGVLVAMAVLLLVALFAAGAAQVSKGRCDLKRGHRVLSATLWGVLMAGCLSAAAYAQWVVHLKPQELAQVTEVMAPQQGDWLIVGGRTPGRGPYWHSSFLLNAKTGTWRQLPVDLWSNRPCLSPDGRWCVGIENTSGLAHHTFELYLMDLSASKPKAILADVTLNNEQSWRSSLLFSPDSSSLAVVTSDQVTVYTLPDLRERASARLAGLTTVWGSFNWNAAFDGPNRLRLYGLKLAKGPARVPTSIDILVLDLATKSLEKTGEIEKVNDTVLRSSPDGKTLLVGRYIGEGEGLSLVDAKTGEVIRDLLTAKYSCPGDFLADGQIVASERTARGAILHLYDPQGTVIGTAPIPPRRMVAFGGEPKPHSVLVYTWPISNENGWFRHGEVKLWSTDDGTATTLKGLHPAQLSLWAFRSGPTGPPARYFTDDRGDLVKVDWTTGDRKVVLRLKGGPPKNGDE